MTKQHFIAIAETIYNLERSDDSGRLGQGTNVQVQDVAEAFADFCAQQNPRFDRERFIAACLEGPGAVAVRRKSFDKRRKGRAA